ncbi:unnamed protein product, partial [Pylaiella littoralis]
MNGHRGCDSDRTLGAMIAALETSFEARIAAVQAECEKAKLALAASARMDETRELENVKADPGDALALVLFVEVPDPSSFFSSEADREGGGKGT